MQLIKWDAIRHQIETAKDIEALTDIKDRLRAYQILAEQSKQSAEVQAKIASYKARADRKCGEWLKVNIKHGGDRKTESKSQHTTLKDVELTKSESSRLQKIANISDERFENILEDAETQVKKVTNNMLVRLSQEDNAKEVDKTKLNLSLYGDNIYFNSAGASENRWDDHIIESDKFPTLTRLSRFFYKNGSEFSLREYAEVQNFPDEYKFVGTYSHIKSQIGNAVSPMMAAYIGRRLKGITFIDLFAGCGGLSLGLENIGKKCLVAVEREKTYFQTYVANHPHVKIITKDVRNVKNLDKADIVVGGPPCQGFSSAGLRLKHDARNVLYKEFLRIVSEVKPNEFLMENVSQIREVKDQIIEDFKEIGYDTQFETVNGLEIGMKQSRKRAFFIGKKTKL